MTFSHTFGGWCAGAVSVSLCSSWVALKKLQTTRHSERDISSESSGIFALENHSLSAVTGQSSANIPARSTLLIQVWNLTFACDAPSEMDYTYFQCSEVRSNCLWINLANIHLIFIVGGVRKGFRLTSAKFGRSFAVWMSSAAVVFWQIFCREIPSKSVACLWSTVRFLRNGENRRRRKNSNKRPDVLRSDRSVQRPCRKSRLNAN